MSLSLSIVVNNNSNNNNSNKFNNKRGIFMAQWLDDYGANLRVVGWNPVHTCICGICFPGKSSLGCNCPRSETEKLKPTELITRIILLVLVVIRERGERRNRERERERKKERGERDFQYYQIFFIQTPIKSILPSLSLTWP